MIASASLLALLRSAAKVPLRIGSPVSRLGARPRADVMLALVITASPGASLSQPVSSAAEADVLEAIVERIGEIQSLHGTASPELIDPIAALGHFYREQGEPALAIAAFERARQLVRTNHGLYALEEAPLLRQLIQIERARGNAEAAWDLEHGLLHLARRNLTDLRAVPVLHEIADERMDLRRRYMAGELPPEIILGCYYAEPVFRGDPSDRGITGCRAGSRRVVIGALTRQAGIYRAVARTSILQHELYARGDLHELGRGVLRGCQFYRGDADPCESELAAVRNLVYEVGSSLPEADGLVRVGDLHLMSVLPNESESCDTAVASYERAHERLREEGVAQTLIDQVLAPAIPVVLGGTRRSALPSREAGSSAEYVEVAFEVTRCGRAERIEILSAGNVPRAAIRDLRRALRVSLFRPRVTNGRFADRSRVVVRYDLSDWDGPPRARALRR
jgi:hypothetical protein